MSLIRLAVLEDEPLFRQLLVGALNEYPHVEVVAALPDARTAADFDATSIDVLIADLHLAGGSDGLEVALKMRQQNPSMGVVVLSNLAMPTLFGRLPNDQVHGWSYLLKTSVSNVNQLYSAIQTAKDGGVLIDVALTKGLEVRKDSRLNHLTGRQVDVLSRMANGWSNKRIADDLGLSVRTVESIISDLFVALGLSTRDNDLHARVACVVAYLEETVPQSPRTIASW